MGEIFFKLLNMSVTAGWLIVAVLCVRLLFRKMPKWLNCLLWGVVALRLVFPFSIESVFSLQPSAEPIQSSTVVGGEVLHYVPSIESKLPIVDNTINPILTKTFAYSETESVAPMQVLSEIAGIVWLIGLLALLAFAIGSMIRLSLMVKEAVPYKDNVYICDAVKTPFILGIIKPRIYLSSSLTEEEIAYIMAHEKSHLSRKDHLWKPFGYILLCIYWFNPLCWVAYIMLCRDIELACDEKVIRDMDFEDKKEYSRVLLSCATRRRMVMACPLAFGEVGVKERVKTVLHYRKPAFWITLTAAIVCVIIAVCFLTNPEKEYQIRITIPAGSTQGFYYSDEEISPKGNALTLENGEGLGDAEVVLKPVEVQEENAYEPTYMTPGMPVKMDVEKGAWFKIGVNMQNPTAEDMNVYVSVRNVEVRITDAEGEDIPELPRTPIEAVSDESSEKIPWADLDGDGTEEYILIERGDFLNQGGINGRITLFVNNEPVYQYVEELWIVGVDEKNYIDLDGDGQKEIFVSFIPAVNSMPLEEWFVLKNKDGVWEKLEMYHNGEDLLDNAFPISMTLHKKPFELEISCEGLEDTILFDSKEYYERQTELEQKNGAYTAFLNGSYEEGSVVGGPLAWGIWQIQTDTFEGENCLNARHGLGGPFDKYDYYGDVEVYFNYDENGKIRILNMEFIPVEQKETGTDVGKAERETLDFSVFANTEFTFYSGAGGWGTLMCIDANGVFSGEYFDNDFGVAGDGYPNGTMYQSIFTGKFTEPVKVDEFIYSTRIQEISYEKEPGTSEVIDGVRYCYEEPNGLQNAEEILIYAPGMPLEKLPREYQLWVGYYDLSMTEETVLPFWGLYNAAEEFGFASYNIITNAKETVASQAEWAASLENSIQNDALTQDEYNEKAELLYNAWDSALNKVWQALQQTLDEKAMSTLTDEELEWITMKEQAVKEAGDEVAGGSIQPMVMNLKAAELTQIRVYELLELLE